MNEPAYVIGVDYGTDSVRSVVVNTATGEELAASVFEYPRWKQGLYCNAAENRWRQHPADYIQGLEYTIKDSLRKAGADAAAKVRGIGVDTTGSTPVAVNEQGVPLALLPEFAENPAAMFVLWKDHTAIGEAEEINNHAKAFDTNYLQFVGGIYSSEWFWAKLLRILRDDEGVGAATHSWVEHCDWIPFLLTGGKRASELKRGVCAAGHKGLWSETWNGFPPNDFFASLDPLLDGFVNRLNNTVYTSDKPAGQLSSEWADRLGLSTDVVVAVGAFDAHMGAVGGEIEPYYLSKVMGTSTCDMLVAPRSEVESTLVSGICGQVDGSVIPGMIGFEAGQSAFGDAYAWLKNILSWPLHLSSSSGVISQTDVEKLKQHIASAIIPALSEAAAQLPVEEESEAAIDWLNGRRTPDADQTVKGAFFNLDLGTDAPRLFRALAESTCFGAKAIVDRMVEQGIPIKGLIGLGGVARKSPFVMQMMADVVGMPIKIHRSEQTCAAGAAMFAATAAGIYSKVEDAAAAMGRGFDKQYEPDKSKTAIYNKRYQQYKEAGAFIEQQSL